MVVEEEVPRKIPDLISPRLRDVKLNIAVTMVEKTTIKINNHTQIRALKLLKYVKNERTKNN